jgi:hypothetical protein
LQATQQQQVAHFDSCEFSDNSASNSGGADYYATDSDDTPTVAILYSGNSADTGGSTFLDDAIAATVSKCTYEVNQAQADAQQYTVQQTAAVL